MSKTPVSECGFDAPSAGYEDSSTYPMSAEPEVAMAVGDPVAQSVYVTVDSFSPASYSPAGDVAAFNVVFNVTAGDQNYKIAKRIGIDTNKLLSQCQAQAADAAIAMESKEQEEQKQQKLAEEKAALEAHQQQIARFRRNAGLE